MVELIKIGESSFIPIRENETKEQVIKEHKKRPKVKEENQGEKQIIIHGGKSWAYGELYKDGKRTPLTADFYK